MPTTSWDANGQSDAIRIVDTCVTADGLPHRGPSRSDGPRTASVCDREDLSHMVSDHAGRIENHRP